MKINTPDFMSNRELLNISYEKAYKLLGVSYYDQITGEAKNRLDVRKMVSDLMAPYCVGRIEIAKRSRVTPNQEGIKLTHTKSLFFNSYPKHLIKDSQKGKWLTEQYDKGEISGELFVELYNTLNLSRKFKKPPVRKSVKKYLEDLFGCGQE